jgi:hypothetical protein
MVDTGDYTYESSTGDDVVLEGQDAVDADGATRIEEPEQA